MHKHLAAFFAAAVTGISAPVIGIQTGDSQADISWTAPQTPVDGLAGGPDRAGGGAR